jgi:TPR repeat protein
MDASPWKTKFSVRGEIANFAVDVETNSFSTLIKWHFGSRLEMSYQGTIMWRLALLMLVLLPMPASGQSQRRAVLIGIDKYDDANLEPLEYAESDATALALSLKAAGYEITLLTGRAAKVDDIREPTKANIERSLRTVLENCKHDDLMLIAFVGHGLRFKNKSGAYLCPKNAKAVADEVGTLISLDEIAKNLGNCAARGKVLLVDACRGAAVGGGDIDGGLIAAAPKGVLALISCSAGERSWEHGSLKHGLFCFHVLQGLKGKAADGNDRVTFASLAPYVRQAVSKQAPGLIRGATQAPFASAGEAADPSLIIATPSGALPAQEWEEYLGCWSASSTKTFLEKYAARRVAGWQTSAEAGSARAMVLLADCFEVGILLARDPVESARWYGKSAGRGNSFAMAKLGICCQQGIGVEKDAQVAVRWFRKAANLGDTWAMELLGTCYLTGSGVVKDENEAMRWYRKSIDLGRDQANYPLAMLYLGGSDVKIDEKEAARLFRIGAERNNRECVFWLGLCYQSGLGVEKDGKQAIRWLRRGAELNHQESIFQLGISSLLGMGMEKDETEAVLWFRKGAELGDAAAMNRLGRCYLDGVGVDWDPQEGARWCRKAAELGNPVGMFNLGKCCLEGTGVPKDRREAARWLLKAVAKGEPNAREILKKLDD